MITLVSACLLGFPCRHDGSDRRDQGVLDALAADEIVPVCPEAAGGLGIPRPAAWREGARVVDALGRDVTAAFDAGARAASAAAQSFGAGRAILKEHSPSCGVRSAGTALGRQPGEGLAAAALRGLGLRLLSEEDVAR